MTIEGLMKDGQVSILAMSDKEHQPHPKFRVAMGLNYPAKFDDAIIQAAKTLIAEAALVLGIDNCAIHAEAMVLDEQVYLIELGARPGGGHIFGQIVEAVSGVSMPQALTGILLGEECFDRSNSSTWSSLSLFCTATGHFCFGQLELKKQQALQGVLDFGFHMIKGTVVNPIEGDADRPGYCVTTAATREVAMAIADKAVSMMRYTMEPLS